MAESWLSNLNKKREASRQRDPSYVDACFREFAAGGNTVKQGVPKWYTSRWNALKSGHIFGLKIKKSSDLRLKTYDF